MRTYKEEKSELLACNPERRTHEELIFVVCLVYLTVSLFAELIVLVVSVNGHTYDVEAVIIGNINRRSVLIGVGYRRDADAILVIYVVRIGLLPAVI